MTEGTRRAVDAITHLPVSLFRRAVKRDRNSRSESESRWSGNGERTLNELAPRTWSRCERDRSRTTTVSRYRAPRRLVSPRPSSLLPLATPSPSHARHVTWTRPRGVWSAYRGFLRIFVILSGNSISFLGRDKSEDRDHERRAIENFLECRM